MKKSDRLIISAIIALFIVQVLLILSSAGESEKNEIRNEAVRLGHAEYVPDEHGNPTFRWKEVQREAE